VHSRGEGDRLDQLAAPCACIYPLEISNCWTFVSDFLQRSLAFLEIPLEFLTRERGQAGSNTEDLQPHRAETTSETANIVTRYLKIRQAHISKVLLAMVHAI
jgi:hypothetical protein